MLGQLGYPTPAAAIPARLARMAAEVGQHVLVADVEGRVVGLATMVVRHVIVQDAPSARLMAIVVSDDRRGQGVGRALVAAAERLAREAGCSVMEVTSAERRAGAHLFYQRLGYVERRRRYLKDL
jgi:GNAT superfamily N-acetyltransferase